MKTRKLISLVTSTATYYTKLILISDAKPLLRIFEVYQLAQLITKPTRMTQWSESLLDVCVANAPVNFQTVTRTIQFIRNQWFLTVWIKGVHEMPQRNDERTTDWITNCSFSRENLNIYIWCNSMYYFLSWEGNTFRCISCRPYWP